MKQLIVDSVEDLYRAENEGVYANEAEYSNLNIRKPLIPSKHTQNIFTV